MLLTSAERQKFCLTCFQRIAEYVSSPTCEYFRTSSLQHPVSNVTFEVWRSSKTFVTTYKLKMANIQRHVCWRAAVSPWCVSTKPVKKGEVWWNFMWNKSQHINSTVVHNEMCELFCVCFDGVRSIKGGLLMVYSGKNHRTIVASVLHEPLNTF